MNTLNAEYDPAKSVDTDDYLREGYCNPPLL